MLKITFDQKAKKFILSAFNKTINQEGFIVEKDNTAQLVLAQDGQEVNYDQFAGIKKGSEVFIKSDLVSIMKLVDALK